MRALFTEQEKQRNSHVFDPDALARAARRQSQDSCREAYVRGVSDSNVAKVLLATESWGSPSMKGETPRVIADDPIYLVVLEQRKQDLLLCPTSKLFPSVA
jgi:hypothetical protein